MKKYIFPCNVNLYDPIGAFCELHTIDWRQSIKLGVGDEVFIYCSKPYQKVMFRTIVRKVEIPISESDKSDLKFSTNNKEIGNSPRLEYARLELMNYCDCEELALKEITKHGITRAPQGQRKITDELYEYLIQYLK